MSWLMLAIAGCAHVGPPSAANAGAAHTSTGAACAGHSAHAAWVAPEVRSGEAMLDFEQLVAAVATSRVVFIGEIHDRFDHHLNQLEIICRLHAVDPNLAIGLEYVQHPYQSDLDAFIAGRSSVEQMLKATEYFERWRFDYRLYAPLFEYARAQRIPLLALNLPSELVSKVGKSGLSSISGHERAALPRTMDRSNAAYRERLRAVFESHPGHEERSFENFLDAQLLWDEGMAEQAARYLEANPERKLVVLAGAGHVAYRDGIPARLEKHLPVSMATVLQSNLEPPSPESADFALLSTPSELPPAGTMGVFLDVVEDGVAVTSFAEDSAAAAAGVKGGDRLMMIDESATATYADVKVALWDKIKGDPVSLRVLRSQPNATHEELSFELNLR